MHYTSGNYEAFARPRKPEGVENKTAWFVGAGLASLAGAAFLIRDGQMAGEKITILERLALPGGALDGIKEPEKGFVIRGGREMEGHFECLWDLFRSIPSIEVEGASVLDEFYWLDKDDPNRSLQRATVNQGQDAHTEGLFAPSDTAQKEIVKVFLATREEMEGKRRDPLGQRRPAGRHWPRGRRPAVHHDRLAHRELEQRRPPHAGHAGRGAGARLGSVAADRGPG
jgi:oleate hydratase